MSRLLIALAAISLLLSPAHVDAGACAQMGLDAQILTHPGDAIPVGGGVVVAYVAYGGLGLDVNDYRVDPALHTDWRFIVGKRKKLKPTITALAPGLAVYTQKKLPKGVKARLADAHGKTLGKLSTARKRKAFTASAPSGKIEISSYSSPRSGTSTSAMVTLDVAIPADAIALILYGSNGDAISWANVKGANGSLVNLYSDPGRCRGNPPGMRAPSDQEKVQLAWVDQFGRVSAHSTDIAVTAAATTVGP